MLDKAGNSEEVRDSLLISLAQSPTPTPAQTSAPIPIPRGDQTPPIIEQPDSIMFTGIAFNLRGTMTVTARDSGSGIDRIEIYNSDGSRHLKTCENIVVPQCSYTSDPSTFERGLIIKAFDNAGNSREIPVSYR